MAGHKVSYLLTLWFMIVLCFWSCIGTSQASSCSIPTPPANAYIYIPGGGQLKEKYGLNETVMFRCKKGYSAVFVECLANGWRSKTKLRCSLDSCGDPGTPTNGRRQGNVFIVNSKVNFTCGRIGYELKGSAQRVCQKNGTWSGTRTTCERVKCKDPGTLRNGVRRPVKTKYLYEDRIDFRCNTNYTLGGKTFISCQSDMTWSGTVPRCLAPCKDPGTTNHGHRHGHSFLHNARVRFTCQRGWNIKGSHTIRCNDGNWDYPTPKCLVCSLPLGMESGKIPDGNIKASSTRWRYHAKYGRLNGRYAWCSGTARDPYFEIDFGKPYKITGLATQGSAYDNKWVEEYTVTSNLAGSSFNVYREANRYEIIFIGNKNKGSVVKNKLRNHVIARKLRIYPRKPGGFSFSNPACMRVEIYGCDLPSDCILLGSRVVAKWLNHLSGGYKYYKAYLISNSSKYWRVELENEKHGRSAQKYFPKYADMPFVLDVPPKHEDLQVGTRVLAPWGHTYYTGTIKTGKDGNSRYRVRADDGDETIVTIDKLRLLKAPTFCN